MARVWTDTRPLHSNWTSSIQLNCVCVCAVWLWLRVCRTLHSRVPISFLFLLSSISIDLVFPLYFSICINSKWFPPACVQATHNTSALMSGKLCIARVLAPAHTCSNRHHIYGRCARELLHTSIHEIVSFWTAQHSPISKQNVWKRLKLFIFNTKSIRCTTQSNKIRTNDKLSPKTNFRFLLSISSIFFFVKHHVIYICVSRTAFIFPFV